MELWHWFLQRGSARPAPCLNTDWGEEASSRVCKTRRAVVQPLQRAGSDSGMNPEFWHIKGGRRQSRNSAVHLKCGPGPTVQPGIAFGEAERKFLREPAPEAEFWLARCRGATPEGGKETAPIALAGWSPIHGLKGRVRHGCFDFSSSALFRGEPEPWFRSEVRGHFLLAVHHGTTSRPAAAEKQAVGYARGAPAGKGEAALPDVVGNLLQRSGAMGARIVFIGDQPIQRPVFGVGGKLRFIHYRAGSAARQDACNAAHPGSRLEMHPGPPGAQVPFPAAWVPRLERGIPAVQPHLP